MGQDREYITGIATERALDKEEREEFEFSKDTSPEYITGTVGRVAKRRVYVSDEDSVPEGASAQEGEQGGIYYETSDLTGERTEEVQDRAEEARGGRKSKARRYVSDPSDAPEGVDVEEGPQGGYYYETGGTGEADIRDEPEDIDGVEIDGADITEGTELEWEDGSMVTVEGMYEDEDGNVQVSISDEATDATSVDIEDIEEQVNAGNLSVSQEGDLDRPEPEPDQSEPRDTTLWEDELVTNYGEGDTITVDTERAGEVTGEITDHEWIEEYDELFLVGEDGSEYSIPTGDITGIDPA